MGSTETPYLEPLDGMPMRSRRSLWYRTAGRRWSRRLSEVAGLRRGHLLAELVALRPSIVVAGTHGKGTTAALIAFALREAGSDPAWLVGAPVPQLGPTGTPASAARRAW